MTTPNDAGPAFHNLLAEYKIIPYSITAIAALLVYDLICTVDQEVEYVWTAPCSIGTIMFVLNRYLPLIDTFISLHLLTTQNTPENCVQGFKVVTWFILLGQALAEIILMLRTYALWERKRAMLITLWVLSAFTFIPAIIVTSFELDSLQYGPPTIHGQAGCFLRRASKVIFIAYVLLIMCESIIVTLTMIKAVSHLRRSHSPWIVKMYKDGFLFYIYVLTISVVNVVIPVAAPPAYANWFATPLRVFHSIFCTRVLLFIFGQRLREGTAVKSSPIFSSFLNSGRTRHGLSLTDEIVLEEVNGSE